MLLEEFIVLESWKGQGELAGKMEKQTELERTIREDVRVLG